MSVFITIRNISLSHLTQQYHNDEPTYTAIPSFYSPDSWPIYMVQPCYSCTIITKRKPFFAPTCYTQDKYYRGTNPVVCSPMCAVQYIYSLRISDSERKKMLSLMSGLLREMTGVVVNVIHASDDRAVLRKYGGSFTENAYQRMIIDASSDYIEMLYANRSDYTDSIR
jgi:hypothetical protein